MNHILKKKNAGKKLNFIEVNSLFIATFGRLFESLKF